MAITLVIQNSRDLERAINKAVIFSSVTLVLIGSALGMAVIVAIRREEGFTQVGAFLLLTSPFILHAIQLLTTIVILRLAKGSPENLSMTKCRVWSVVSRILTAPILIEMMVLIGFKWYLTIVAIPLVLMYFVTMLQVEQIMHYFFTRNLSSRIPSGNRQVLLFEYPFNVDLNSSFYRLSASCRRPTTTRGALDNQNPIYRPTTILNLNLNPGEPPPSYLEALAGSGQICLNLDPSMEGSSTVVQEVTLSDAGESPPPAYTEAVKALKESKKEIPQVESGFHWNPDSFVKK